MPLFGSLDRESWVPRGWIWHIYRQGSAEYFLGFEFRKSIFLGVLLTAAVFFGLLDKCCIFKCFIFLTVFLGPVLCTLYFSNHGSPLLSYRA